MNGDNNYSYSEESSSRSSSSEIPFGSDFSDSDDSYRETTVIGGSTFSVLPIPLSLYQTETIFQCCEDDHAFRGIPKYCYQQIKKLKGITPIFFNYDFHSRLSATGKERLGTLLSEACERGQGPVIFNLSFDGNRPQLLEDIFRGPFQRDHDLGGIRISGGDIIDVESWNRISHYLQKAPKLHILDLSEFMMGRVAVERLILALQRVGLKFLGLRDMTYGGNLLREFFTSIDTTQLLKMSIVDCGIGAGVCEGLASILRNKRTKLEILRLIGNPIDDECIKILCESLAQNRTLKTLHLGGVKDVTDQGWELIEKIVYNPTNLNTLYQSNHILEFVYGRDKRRRPRLRFNHNNNRIRRNMEDGGHYKIIRFLTRHPTKFDMNPFVGFDVKMIPAVLEFFQKAHHATMHHHRVGHLLYLYQIIRYWNIHELFSFPSAERVQLSARMDEIESENQELHKEMEKLRLEITRLINENAELKAGRQFIGETHQKTKQAKPN